MHDIVPRKKGMYTSITINIVSQKKTHIPHLMCFQTHMCACVSMEAHLCTHTFIDKKIQFLCTNMLLSMKCIPKHTGTC